jgi:hypothetical protein
VGCNVVVGWYVVEGTYEVDGITGDSDGAGIVGAA